MEERFDFGQIGIHKNGQRFDFSARETLGASEEMCSRKDFGACFQKEIASRIP